MCGKRKRMPQKAGQTWAKGPTGASGHLLFAGVWYRQVGAGRVSQERGSYLLGGPGRLDPLHVSTGFPVPNVLDHRCQDELLCCLGPREALTRAAAA